MNTYVVDTHALVWFLDGDRRLSSRAREILRNEAIPLVGPTIVLIELKHLAHRRRFSVTLEDVLRAIASSARTTIYPTDLNVVEAAPPELEIHDSLIVGTALALRPLIPDIAVLTRDEMIAQSRLVPTIW